MEKESKHAESGASDNGGARDAITARTSLLRPAESLLTEEMLARFASRAASYDQENRFFDEDFEELRSAKYLLLPLPREFGGAGMKLAEVCREQRRLAYHAPATALAVNKRKPTYAEAAKAMQSANSALYQVLLRVDVRLGGKNAAGLNRRFHAWVGVK
jgi:alkylation response protein AidB-like acyl-CoA dehydrogenase